jgi:hypothetical protein
LPITVVVVLRREAISGSDLDSRMSCRRSTLLLRQASIRSSEVEAPWLLDVRRVLVKGAWWQMGTGLRYLMLFFLVVVGHTGD